MWQQKVVFMKTVLSLLFVVLLAGSAAAQQEPLNRTIEKELKKHGDRSFVISTLDKPNEITHGRLTYSGISVELAKDRNPLQLFNPWAADDRSGYENLHLDPINGRPSGLNLFSIRF
jgi:hypothetical protein